MNIKFRLLGTGSSMGVPRPDGFFGNCDPKNKKNYRTRCSALISFGESNILIDTSPDLRQQLLDAKIKTINGVLYSHFHADQTHGINDLRAFFLNNGIMIPIYCDDITSKYLKNNFSYCFKKNYDYDPMLKINELKKKFKVKMLKNSLEILAIPVKHGSVNSIAYIIEKKIAYISDVNEIYLKDMRYFKKLKYLIIDCLRFKKHPSHFSLNEIIHLTNKLKPKKTILTNLHTDLDYDHLIKILPNNILPGFDGLSIIA
jgi:phosphoribosyl 1,2-cyclic phosphate phosphodiesterase